MINVYKRSDNLIFDRLRSSKEFPKQVELYIKLNLIHSPDDVYIKVEDIKAEKIEQFHKDIAEDLQKRQVALSLLATKARRAGLIDTYNSLVSHREFQQLLEVWVNSGSKEYFLDSITRMKSVENLLDQQVGSNPKNTVRKELIRLVESLEK